MKKKCLRQVIVVLVMFVCLLPVLSNHSLAANPGTYIVQSGDSLWKIANKFDTTISTLRQMNNLWTNYLEVGQVLKVPTGVEYYTVQWGDSLWKISQGTGVSITAIKEANNLYSNYIEVGQILMIPRTTIPSVPSPNPEPLPTPDPKPTLELTKAELDLFARVLYAEAQGEPYQGKVAVAAVIVNRIKSSRFPNTLNGVIYQRFAFESVASGYIWKIQPDASVYRAAKEALQGSDPTDGAIYFYNPAKVSNPNNWIWSREVTLRIGDHVFAI